MGSIKIFTLTPFPENGIKNFLKVEENHSLIMKSKVDKSETIFSVDMQKLKKFFFQQSVKILRKVKEPFLS